MAITKKGQLREVKSVDVKSQETMKLRFFATASDTVTSVWATIDWGVLWIHCLMSRGWLHCQFCTNSFLHTEVGLSSASALVWTKELVLPSSLSSIRVRSLLLAPKSELSD